MRENPSDEYRRQLSQASPNDDDELLSPTPADKPASLLGAGSDFEKSNVAKLASLSGSSTPEASIENLASELQVSPTKRLDEKIVNEVLQAAHMDIVEKLADEANERFEAATKGQAGRISLVRRDSGRAAVHPIQEEERRHEHLEFVSLEHSLQEEEQREHTSQGFDADTHTYQSFQSRRSPQLERKLSDINLEELLQLQEHGDPRVTAEVEQNAKITRI